MGAGPEPGANLASQAAPAPATPELHPAPLAASWIVRPGDVVYDHLSRRTARVVEVGGDGTPRLERPTPGGPERWACPGLYARALERLERPDQLVIWFESATSEEARERLLQLGPAELAVALARGLRTGVRRSQGPVLPLRALCEEARRLGGAAAERAVLEGVRLLQQAGDPRLLPIPRDRGSLRVVLPAPSRLLERLLAPPLAADLSELQAGRHRTVVPHAPLVPHGAPRPGDDDLLGWALREVCLLATLGRTRSELETARRNTLDPPLRATFRAWIERRACQTSRRRRAEFDLDETLVDETFELLLERLAGDLGAPRAIADLRRRLAEGPGEGDGDRPTVRALVMNALGACVDLLAADRLVRAQDRPLSLDRGWPDEDPPELPEVPDRRLPPPQELRDYGLREFEHHTRAIAGANATDDERLDVGRHLLRLIRDELARRLVALRDRHGERAYRTQVLDFCSYLSLPDMVAFSGERENTVRGRYPRRGDRRTPRVPGFVRALVPDELQAHVERFGRLFPMLRCALVPDEEEIGQLARTDGEYRALRWLFLEARLSRSNDGWRERDLLHAARLTDRLDVPSLVAEVLFPFLEDLLALRRDRSAERGTPSPAAEAEAAFLLGLEVLLFGAPDGRALEELLAARHPDPSARAARLAAAGLEPLALADLVLGRRWATSAEQAALERELGDVAARALDGLRPALPVALLGADVARRDPARGGEEAA